MLQRERELAELKELKNSSTNEIVTRGLNPNVALKDSGIEWIGTIPRHWDVLPLKYLVTCNDEVLSENTDPDKIIKYVEIGDVSSVNGIYNITEYKFKEAPSRARRVTHPNDVIVSTVRTYLKAIATIKEKDLIVSTGFAVLRPKNINSTYLSIYANSEPFISYVIANSVGVSYPAITSSQLLEAYVPLPPIEEQKRIAEYIDLRFSKIDFLIGELEKQIEEMKEYKTALISEVVTGKIKITTE